MNYKSKKSLLKAIIVYNSNYELTENMIAKRLSLVLNSLTRADMP